MKIDIPPELTDPEVVEMDFGDCLDFMRNNGEYLNAACVKGLFYIVWVVGGEAHLESDVSIFKAIARVIEKVRNGQF